MAEVATGVSVKVERGTRARRLLFIDNIRWSMIVLVLSMHAVDTFSPFGNWYYVDRQPASLGTKLFFGIYQSFLQAFFMALLFLVAGYFSAAAYDRKGFVPFLRDRFLRLGIPTLLYMFVIGPLTQYYLSRTWGSGGFARQWILHIRDGEWLSETGPMWFCAALLLFSGLYGLARLAGWRETATRIRWQGIAAFVVVMALATFLVRVAISADKSVLNVHPGDFPQYLLMFAAGAYGYRGDWLDALSDRFSFRLAALMLGTSVLLFAGLVLFGGALQGDTAAYAGGINAVSAGKCLWEALVCVGMTLLILNLYRRAFDGQGAITRSLSDNAFGVYLIHPPVLIALAIMLHPLGWHAVAKAALLTLLAALASFAVSALILRKSPLRAVL